MGRTRHLLNTTSLAEDLDAVVWFLRVIEKTASRVCVHGAKLFRQQRFAGAGFQRVPEQRDVPAASQVADLSSAMIDKPQHTRAPEISQRRAKKQESHTVR